MRPHFDWSPRIAEGDEPVLPEPAPAEPPTEQESVEHDDTIRMDAEQAEELVAPRSRPTLSDTPRALHSTETEDELDFFLAGEEGRYEGGPATLVPLAIDEEEERPRLPPPDPAVLARRGRNVRVVSMIVGAMAAIFGVGLVRGNATAQSPAESVEVAAQVAPAAAPKQAAPTQPIESTKPVEVAVVKAAEPEPEPERQREPAAAPEPTPVATPEPTPVATPGPKKLAAAGKPRARNELGVIAAPKPEPAPEPTPPPAPIEPSGPPPTAAFPAP